MLRLFEFFSPHVRERDTFDELHTMVGDEDSWCKAHDLFDQIRRKNLKASSEVLGHQYAFEEICAKTIFNLTDTDMPFDTDAPYWVVPIALKFAEKMGMESSEIVKITTES